MKRASFFLGVFGFVTAGALGFGGCASFESDICGYGICKGGSEAGGDGTLPDGTLPDTSLPDANVPGCPTNDDPAKNPEKCFTDELAAFVSAEAAPGGNGTRLRPFRTIGEGLTATTKPRIVVCEGRYTESLTVQRGVEIFSAVNCVFTAPGKRAQIFAPAGKEAAVFIDRANGVRLVDLEISGPATGVPNSIAVLLNASLSTRIVRSLLSAGVGANGDNGVLVPLAGLDVRATQGGGTTSTTAGEGATHTCPSGGPSGGGGAGGAGSGQAGGNGGPLSSGGAGGTGTDCAAGGTGRSASDTVGRLPAPGAADYGKLNVIQWSPAEGTTGATGESGKGGGGGAGTGGGGGGGGGAGGCGGAGGGAGKGGGGSFALLSTASEVGLLESELRTAKGGKGGTGAGGQVGQSGGLQGAGAPPGCTGGIGGKGGDGAAGGGGAGGLSVAIAYFGNKPTRDPNTKLSAPASNAGEKGTGGAPGMNDGTDGKAADEFELPQ